MKRSLILAGALAFTLGALTLAMLLGGTAFRYRTCTQHQSRLTRVLEKSPSAEGLAQGFAEEQTLLLASPTSRQEVDRAIATHGGARAAELRAKAASHARLRLFRAGDTIYAIFFDGGDVMRDFTCICP